MVELQRRIDSLPMLISNTQKFFMMKEQECGSLKSLLSRATVETSKHIDRIVQGILEIYNSCGILPADKKSPRVDPKIDVPVIMSFQVMLMNTNFYSQYRLTEDMLRGHQVGMWPALSPYLLIQIIWGLRCEELLPRFVLYLPLELSIEILTITISCLAELEFERVMNLVIQLANYVYKFIYRLGLTGTEIYPCEYIRQLLANFQELLDQLTNPRVTRFSDLSEQLRYERQGIILKSIIRMNKLCTTERTHGGIQDNSENLYILTFGNEVREKVPSELLKSCINEMDQFLITLLIKHLKEVNCNMYLAWIEAEDQENPLLSLQRAIIMECVYFVKIIQMDAKLQENQELQTCLDQLIGSHKQPQLTLQEICNGIQSGQLTDMKDLLVRYREWNESTLSFICVWDKLLLNENFEVFFNYLKYTSSMKHYTQEEKLRLQLIVMKIMIKRSVKDLYDITLIYILHHYNDTFLQELYNKDNFYALMKQSAAWNSPYFLKALLIHILHSPKKVLMSLISMTISKSYEFVCSPQQLLILRPFLRIKLSSNKSFLSEVLYQLCLDPHDWDLQKYTNFIVIMLKAFVTSPEDLIINVFVRYLVEQPFDQNNIACVLMSIYRILETYTLKLGMVDLCLVLGRKISNWRKCEPTKLRNTVNELLWHLLLVLKKCAQKQYYMTVEQKRQVLDNIALHIEPLDKAIFSPFMYMVENNILTIIDDYARRCYSMRRIYKQTQKSDDAYTFIINNIQLEKQDFIRHMILHVTEVEYKEYCLDLAVKYWFFFGWLDEIDAYDNVTRITTEAMRIGLEHPENVPFDSFPMLLRYCILFTEKFVSALAKSRTTYRNDTIMQILLKNMSLVTTSIRRKEILETYKLSLTNLETIIKTTNSVEDYCMEIDGLVGYILNQENPNVTNETDEVLTNLRNWNIEEMFDSYKFICICFSISGTEKHHRFIEKVEDMMFSEEFGYLNYHPL